MPTLNIPKLLHRITLADTPDDPEGSYALPVSLKNMNMASIMSLNLNLNLNNLTTTPITNATQGSSLPLDTTHTQTNTFSISDFLVPGLQSKAWEDWQGMVDMNDYTNKSWNDDAQDFSSDLNSPFQFGFDGVGDSPIWGNSMIPADQAYDEFVFDLAPSAFAPPTTVNVADLIVGPNSTAPSVSPSELSLPVPLPDTNNYQDLALASLYGFTEPSNGLAGSDSEMDDDCESSDDDEEDSDEDAELQAALLATVKEASFLERSRELTSTLPETVEEVEDVVAPISVVPEDPNKRRMEEALVARISNDLGPEHMSGLFKILKGTEQEDEDEDEEMEVDLSRLDETTLVQVYQYVETCCMQTMGSILAEERERAQEEENERKYHERTPELTSGHSSSSVSPSPPHPSSKGRSINRKRASPSPYDVELEQDNLSWTHTNTNKNKRKRSATNNGAASTASMGLGGGATKKGRRTTKEDRQTFSIQEPIVLHVHRYDEEEIGEDDEIDVVGI
ncbi:hypothetical protein BG003_008851 [Podila horticola]|nr:hypothetical protein BG003_008851 [Podila horticola]